MTESLVHEHAGEQAPRSLEEDPAGVLRITRSKKIIILETFCRLIKGLRLQAGHGTLLGDSARSLYRDQERWDQSFTIDR